MRRKDSSSTKAAQASPIRLDAETVKFIEANDVAIYVATSDSSCRAHTARAYGCRVSQHDHALTTWVARPAAALVLDDLASNGRLAFTVSHIPTCRTLQLKSVDAEIVNVDSDDFARVLAHQEGFVRTTAAVGYPESVMRNTIKAQPAELAAIRFTPTAVFKQTPGVGAGTKVTQAAEALAT